MAAKVGKKGKKKGQKMALTDFLSDEQGNTAGPGTSYVLANKTVDWAQEMEDLDNTVDTPYSLTTSVDRTKLPTAPKAARILEDLDSVPKEPPFTAFIGNLPYEVSEEKIKEFFQKLSVVNVRLPEENGRFRGFGYVQFDTRQGLIDALTKNEDTLAGRKIRVDLADQSQHGGSKDGKGGSRDDGPDRTQGDWRRSEPDDRGPSRSFDDRGPSRGFDDRGPSRGFDDRGGRGFEDRGGSRGGFGGRNYDDRGGRGGFEDRGGRGFDDRGGRGYDDRRGGGGGFQGGRDRYDDRDGGRRGFGSGFRDGDRRDDRGGYGSRDRSDRDTWERGPAVDRSNERDVRPSYRSERPESREPDNTPKERPRLQLQPRSKPADDTGLSQAEKDAKSASIFGGAKPIDTARREREIEERLQKQREAPPPRSDPESRGYGMSRGYDDHGGDRRYDHDNKENKEIPKLERGSRKKSEGSDQEGERRRHSSSSSNKGKKGSRGRRESGESGGHPDGLSEGEDSRGDKGHNAISSPTGKEEPAVFVPAPPPKQNIWEVRKTTQTTSPPQKTAGPSSPPVQESKSQPRTAPTSDKTVNQTINQSDNESTRSTQPSQQNASHSNHTDGTKKDLVPADPPKENPWTRRKQEMDKQPPSRPSQPSSSDSVLPRSGPPNAWAGRGRGERGRGRGGAGRGRGGEPPKPKQERREKPLPNSIDEMPKLETAAAKDFSDGNKFANLLDDADDVDE